MSTTNRCFFTRNATTLFLLVFLSAQLVVAEDSALEGQLKAEYANKILTLRHFYTGDHLTFHSDGSLQGDAAIGPWTVAGQIAVQEIRVRDKRLIIQGRRVYRIFDSQQKPQDELNTIDNYQGAVRAELEKNLLGLNVEIDVELPGKRSDRASITSAMRSVFLADGESMMGVVPEYWQAYFAKLEGRPAIVSHSVEPLYVFRPGNQMIPPKPISNPEPEFSPEASKMKYEGTELVKLVIDERGATRDLQVNRPLGLGLDEMAIAAIRTWTFEPARKDGQPVAVSVVVEVTFRLY